MDARTFKKEEHIKNKLHVHLVVATYNSLPAAIAYHPDQKWYYYSRQKTNEVLVFHQYTKVDFVIFYPLILHKDLFYRRNGWPIHIPLF